MGWRSLKHRREEEAAEPLREEAPAPDWEPIAAPAPRPPALQTRRIHLEAESNRRVWVTAEALHPEAAQARVAAHSEPTLVLQA
jgi:hypothetical protein